MSSTNNQEVADTVKAFEFYHAIRDRLPEVTPVDAPPMGLNAPDLLTIADKFDVFVFDAFGVLNVGSSAIAGAPECIDALRKLGKTVFVLTNAASTRLLDVADKFVRLGYDFNIQEIVSSRHAAEQSIMELSRLNPNLRLWGAVTGGLSSPDDLSVNAIELDAVKFDYDRVDAFIFLSSSGWTNVNQKLLHATLRSNPRPVVIANPDVVAPFESEFSREPGFFAHLLLNELSIDVEFHGKPFPSVYDIVRDRMTHAVAPERIAMLGDTLHTDVLGANSQGWSSILVSDHGLFRGHDVTGFIEQSGIVPGWIIPSI